jgi:hypothetical protein
MSKQVQIIEAPPELLEHLAAQDKQREEESAAYKKALSNMSAEEVHKFLEDHLAQTDILVESLNLCSSMSMSDAIFVATLNRLRSGIDAALMWLESHHNIKIEEAQTEEKQNKNESPKTEGKRLVYGANSVEDESEQL